MVTSPEPASRREASRRSGETPVSPELLRSFNAHQRWIDDMLERVCADPDELSEWEHLSIRYERAAWDQSLNLVRRDHLLMAILGVQRLMSPGQSPRFHRRACHLLARLSGLTSTLTHTAGDPDEADRWFDTAQRLAAQAADQRLQANLMALSANVPVYAGRPELGLKRVHAAQALAGERSVPPMLDDMEISALLGMGRAREAEHVLRRLETRVERWNSPVTSPVEGYYYQWHLHWIAGRVHSDLGSGRAQHRFAQAVAELPASNTPLIAMIRFDQARDLAWQGEITEACRTVRAVLAPTLPTGIVDVHLGRFLSAVPRRHRNLKVVRNLRDEFRRPPSQAARSPRGARKEPGDGDRS